MDAGCPGIPCLHVDKISFDCLVGPVADGVSPFILWVTMNIFTAIRVVYGGKTAIFHGHIFFGQ